MANFLSNLNLLHIVNTENRKMIIEYIAIKYFVLFSITIALYTKVDIQ